MKWKYQEYMMVYIQDKGKVIKTRETMNLPWEHFLPCREQWILSRRCACRTCGWCLRWCQNSNWSIGQIGLWVWSKQTWSLLNVEVETSRSEKTGIQRWFEQQREKRAWILLFFPYHWRYHTALWEKIKRVLCRLGCSWAANCWLGSLF